MYLVNKDKKTLERVPKAAFRDVGVRERKDLQEWMSTIRRSLARSSSSFKKSIPDRDIFG